MIQFLLNDKVIGTQLPGGMVLVDFIRYRQHLTGTKIGCREGDCGACTILTGELDGEDITYTSVTSCLMPLANAHGKHIVTIEGINMKEPGAVQQAMCDEGATQCGFCTPGIVMSLTGLCLGKHVSTGNGAADLKKFVAAVDGNICRCTGYKSIERAALRVGSTLPDLKGEHPVAFLTRNKMLPSYFSSIKQRLLHLKNQYVSNGSPTLSVDGPLPQSGFLSGGTDLFVQQPEAMLHKNNNYLFNRSELKGVTRNEHQCMIGASATVSDLLGSSIMKEHFPGIGGFFKLVSSTPIRNMATVSGNFINASPIGDLTIFFLALGADLILSDDHSDRQLSLQDLYLGYKLLAKKPEEYIKEIRFQLPGKSASFNFEKVSKRTHLDIASVNTAVLININDERITEARLSAGGVGPVPLFLSQASTFLEGKELSVDTVQQAIEVALEEISPISDVRGTATYKRLLLKQLIKAHFITLFPHLRKEALIYG